MEILTIADIKRKKFPDTRPIQDALKAYAASNLDADWSCGSSDPEGCPRQDLLPVYWYGRQWAVTEYGIECMYYDYAIEKDRLWADEKSYGLVRHMFAKCWIDPCDFAEALRIARHIHREHCHAPA